MVSDIKHWKFQLEIFNMAEQIQTSMSCAWQRQSIFVRFEQIKRSLRSFSSSFSIEFQSKKWKISNLRHLIRLIQFEFWINPGWPFFVERLFDELIPVNIGFSFVSSRQINGPPKSSWCCPLNGAVKFVFDGSPAHNWFSFIVVSKWL